MAQSSAGKNGWVIQYFVAGTDDYNFEGFNLFGRFYNSGKVTLASDHKFLRNGNAGKYTEHTSTYEMLAEEGSVLAFNTWNDILTVFVDPVDPTKAPGQLINNGEGMYGDQNLVLKKLADDEIQFYGERHGAITRVIPCDRPWQQYIDDTQAMKNRIATTSLTSYYVINETDTMFFKDLNKGLFTYCERINDPLQKKTFKCVFTPNGFRMERPEIFGESSFQEFTVNSDTTCLKNEDGKIKVVACWDTYVTNFTNVWSINLDSLSADQKALVSQLDVELKKANSTMTFTGLKIGEGGTHKGSKVRGLILSYSYTSRKKVVNAVATVGLNFNRPSYGKMTINYTDENPSDDNLANFASLSENNVADVLRQLASTFAGNYEMVPNSYFLPTSVSMKSINGSTSSFDIYK